MKSTGIVRRLDNLGRVVIPKELRTSLDMLEYANVEIFTEGEYVIIGKFHHKCIMCGNEENLTDFNNKRICLDCANQLGKIAA